MYSGELKLEVVLYAVPAVVFLALAAWCLGRAAGSRSAALGAAGAGLLGLGIGVPAASELENLFLHSSHIVDTLLVHRHVSTALLAAEAVGALLLAGAFVESRRTPPARSIYGPE